MGRISPSGTAFYNKASRGMTYAKREVTTAVLIYRIKVPLRTGKPAVRPSEPLPTNFHRPHHRSARLADPKHFQPTAVFMKSAPVPTARGQSWESSSPYLSEVPSPLEKIRRTECRAPCNGGRRNSKTIFSHYGKIKPGRGSPTARLIKEELGAPGADSPSFEVFRLSRLSARR